MANALFPALKFSKEATQDFYIGRAVQIAERFMETEFCRDTFKFLKVDWKKSEEKLKEVTLLYEEQDRNFDKGEKYHIAWTLRDKDANQIFLNIIFRNRFDKISSTLTRNKLREVQIITFFMAIAIIHEVAHLLLRWNGVMKSPAKFGHEVGHFTENKLFNGITRAIIIPNGPWNENSEFWGKFIYIL